jgi:membrane fusion protein (multidrug efflux system)
VKAESNPGRTARNGLWKRIAVVLAGLAILVGALAGVKVLQIRAMIDQGKKFVPPPETVSTAEARAESWERSLTAVGSLVAVQGVTVAAELPGKVVRIAFEPGRRVAAGALLLLQDTSSEEAQLPGAVAREKQTLSVLDRSAKMLAEQIVSQADYDAAVSDHEQAAAQTNGIRAAIAKKAVRAPFGGRLGIRLVNLGQILRDGDPIVTLQTLDPIYVNFTLPQQQLAHLHPGLPVRVTSDSLPGATLAGRITTVSPLVDAETRNIQLQATIANRSEQLRPGMFVNVSVGLPARQKVLAIPATAVLYAPYGDSVFVVAADNAGKGGLALRQQFLRLGERRGDFVAVEGGLKAGERIVSTGVFKLRNGQAVVVDNRLSPAFRKSPVPENN